MSDQELTNRLRQIGQRVAVPCPDGIKGCAVFHYRVETEPTCAEAADRIEQLVNDNHRWKMECEEFWRKREDAAEAKLAKAVEALRNLTTCVEDGCYCSEIHMATVMDESCAVLAELEKTE
jgi:hypothetical protein